MNRIGEWLLSSLLLCGASLQGCASLDARPDYERVSELVSRSTGYGGLALPGEERDVEAEATKLFDGGLTADEAVQVCLLKSPRLRAVLLEVGVSRAEFAQASFLKNPSLALALRFPSGGGSANLEAGLAQNLADLWRLPLRRAAAKASLKRAVFEVAREVSGLAYEAKAAYVRALAADRMEAIAAENREIAARFYEIARARKEGGEGSGIDVGFARSELSSAEVALHAASLASFERRAELASRLGVLAGPDELVLADALPSAGQVPLDVQTVLETIPKRPDLEAASRAIESAESSLRYEHFGFLSLFSVGAEYERPERRSGEERESSDDLIGPSLGMDLPLFDQNRAQVARARLVLEQTTQLRDGLLIEATQQARAARERVASSLEIARLYQAEVLRDREENLRLVRDAYAAGELPVASMLEAQRGLLATRVDSVKALEVLALAWIELEKAAARPVAAKASPVGQPPQRRKRR